MKYIILDISGGSAALLSLFDGLDLLDPFEVTRDFLLQKRLEHQVRQRGLGVQQNLRHSAYVSCYVSFYFLKIIYPKPKCTEDCDTVPPIL